MIKQVQNNIKEVCPTIYFKLKPTYYENKITKSNLANGIGVYNDVLFL